MIFICSACGSPFVADDREAQDLGDLCAHKSGRRTFHAARVARGLECPPANYVGLEYATTPIVDTPLATTTAAPAAPRSLLSPMLMGGLALLAFVWASDLHEEPPAPLAPRKRVTRQRRPTAPRIRALPTIPPIPALPPL